MNRYALYLIAAMLLVGGNVGVGKSVGKSIVAFIPVPLFALPGRVRLAWSPVSCSRA